MLRLIPAKPRCRLIQYGHHPYPYQKDRPQRNAIGHAFRPPKPARGKIQIGPMKPLQGDRV